MEPHVVSITVNADILALMKEFYAEQIEDVSNPHLLFAAKSPECSIHAYRSLKVVFQGKGAVSEALIWQAKLPDFSNPRWKYMTNHGGSDEVGTGDYFGPIIVVACYVKEEDIDFLNSLGVQDSKLIKDDNILSIAPKLLKRISYSQLHLSNEKYNILTQQGFNMNRIKAYLHNQALLHLRKKVKESIPYFVMDQFTPESNYFRYLTKEKIIERNIRFVTKGESVSPAVAAASILARYSFLQHLKQLEKDFGIIIPKGAGAQVDQAAAIFYETMTPQQYGSITKLNFKNTEKVKEIVKLNQFE